VLSFTLDTNCLVAVEEGRSEAEAVRELAAQQRAGRARVRLVVTTAAENQRDGTVLDDFSRFQRRISGLGLGESEILAPVAVCDLTYVDRRVLAGMPWTRSPLFLAFAPFRGAADPWWTLITPGRRGTFSPIA
jgi:hypothetical protein